MSGELEDLSSSMWMLFAGDFLAKISRKRERVRDSKGSDQDFGESTIVKVRRGPRKVWAGKEFIDPFEKNPTRWAYLACWTRELLRIHANEENEARIRREDERRTKVFVVMQDGQPLEVHQNKRQAEQACMQIEGKTVTEVSLFDVE